MTLRAAQGKLDRPGSFNDRNVDTATVPVPTGPDTDTGADDAPASCAGDLHVVHPTNVLAKGSRRADPGTAYSPRLTPWRELPGHPQPSSTEK
jgi:hypothetical protein